jgi:hypothetical protein
LIFLGQKITQRREIGDCALYNNGVKSYSIRPASAFIYGMVSHRNINNVRKLGPDRGYSWRGRSVGLLSVRNGEFNYWYYIVPNKTKRCTSKDMNIILISLIAFLDSVIYI